MERKVRAYLTELIGTFCLVFLTSAAVCIAPMAQLSGWPPFTRWELALADGCALGVLLTITAANSEGCLNPAITLMLWVCRRMDGWQTLALILLQLAGAVLAGLALRFVFPESALIQSRLGTPHVADALLGDGRMITWTGLLAGIAVEALMTFVLTLVIFYTLLDKRDGRLGGLYAGLTQIVLTLASFDLTGAAANPARWFGPALWQLTLAPLKASEPFADNTVYWVGPILGALLAGLLYTTVIGPPGKRTEAAS
jgi:glycerol uptake facilitator-like aquaporin